MNNPWGLSGPAFLWLYAGGLVAAVAWLVAVRMRARRPDPPSPGPAPSTEELAFLAGGARRLVELSIARLIAKNTIRVNRTGSLTSTTKRTPHDPLDAAVHGTLGGRTARPGTLIPRVSVAEHAERLAGTLSDRGLVIMPAAAARARRRAAFGLFAVFGIGFLRLANGLAGGWPVGYLVVALMVTAVLLLVLFWTPIRPTTVHGDRIVAEVRETYPTDLRAVALLGLGSFPDSQIRSVLSRTAPSRKGAWAYSAGAGGAYASCSAGGGGGGAGCGGGGGGGGCGGGGGG